MKNLNTVREAILEADYVFLPNRYTEPFIDAFQELTDLEVPKQKDRELTVYSGNKMYSWIRGRDIPKVLSKGPANAVGLTGSEWCMEFESFAEEKSIEWVAACSKSMGRIALAAPKNCDPKKIKEQVGDEFSNPVRVITAYPNYANSLGSKGYNIETAIGVNGCTESVAKALELPALDLVSTGETLRANGFNIIKDIVTVYPVVVRANPLR